MPKNALSNVLCKPAPRNDELSRAEYLSLAIAHYLAAPDTPERARRADWALAGVLWKQGVELTDIAHAIRLSILRRHKRGPELEALEPICSLAYFRPFLDNLRRIPHDPGYVEYIGWSYVNYFKAR